MKTGEVKMKRQRLNVDSVDHCILTMTKTLLCESLNESSSKFHLESEEKHLKTILNSAFKNKKSNAIVVMGDIDSGKEKFVDDFISVWNKVMNADRFDLVK